ncbi:hypothetical protein FACS1894156_2690 [Bacteroidia bacterium]|nr:hypothetical protein FACS1894156_2690 [Bacteroidia bacterium]
MKYLFSFIFWLPLAAVGFAQPFADTDTASTEAAGMEFVETEDAPEEVANFVPVVLSDAEYQARLEKLPCVIHLPYNAIVRNYIMLYTGKKIQKKAEEIIGLTEYYFPIIEPILDSYGLPLEFKYLPIIESALNPQAVSRVGATGLWQFMYGTAKRYDVRITSTIDDRRDPIVSTHAAARHLNDLYREFHDWTLVIAAYNCGSGNVRKAMRRSGKYTFWDIYRYLPLETRGYVPAFIGATYMMNYYQEHHLTPKKFDYAAYFNYDTVQVNVWMHFDQVAAVVGVPISILRDLNPQYRRDIIPGNESPCSLKLPAKYVNKYIDNERTIAFYKSDMYNPVKMATAAAFTPFAQPSGKNLIKHTVRSGETLGAIANMYSVRVSDLRSWNNLRKDRIYQGQKINIYTKSYTAQVQAKNNAGTASAKTPQEQLVSRNGYLCYLVKSGDTLWDICQRYKYLGITMEDIQDLNQLNKARNLLSGQTLKIKKI